MAHADEPADPRLAQFIFTACLWGKQHIIVHWLAVQA